MMQAQFNTWGIVQWKTLTWAEYKKFEDLMNLKGPMAVSNDIYRAVVVNGPSIHDATAGLVEFVAKSVFSGSAFSGSYNVLTTRLEENRDRLTNDFLLAAQAIIASIFHYTFEEMDLWDEDTFLLRLSQAEFVAGKPLPLGKVEVEADNKQPIPIDQNKPRKRELSDAQKLVIERSRGR